MDSFENILKKILASHQDKTREQVLELVEKRKDGSNGLLSDVGAISLIAQQLLVQQDSFEGLEDQKIVSAHAGLNDVTISGEILDLSELREFPRQDGTTGKVLRVQISDQSGKMDCALWDMHAEQLILQGAKIGARLRLEHGYTKHGRGGIVEFHLGNKGRFRLFDMPHSKNNGGGEDQLPWTSLARLVGNPGPSASRIRLRLRRLEGQKSPNGPVTALCEDETGLVMVKFWDDKIEEATRIGDGKTIIIGNPTTAERNGIAYVNVGRNSLLKEEKESGETAKTFVSENLVLSELKVDLLLHTLTGKIVDRSEPKEVETREGRWVNVANVRLEDGTGKVRVSLWDDHARRAESLRLGDTVKLIGVRLREGFNQEVEGSSVFLTMIEKLS